MRKTFRTIPSNPPVRLDTKKVPDYVAMDIAQTLLAEVQKAYHDPVIYADYLRWKREQEEKRNHA